MPPALWERPGNEELEVARRSRLLTAVGLLLLLAINACGEALPTDHSTAAPVDQLAQAAATAAPPTTAVVQPPGAAALPTPQTAPTVVSASPVPRTPTPTPTATPTLAVRPTPQAASPTPTPAPPRTTVTPAEPTTTPEPDDTVAVNGGTPPADLVSLTQDDQALTTVEVVKILRPSVAHIATQRRAMEGFNQTVQEGVGTGIVLDEKGHILTNNHVIEGAERIIVTLSTGDSFPAVVVGRDPRTDTAVVRIEAAGLEPAVLGNSAELEVGEDVIAIGHALGLRGGPTVSKGVVSALGRSLPTNPQTTIVDLIQTDASINPGNSGGPLVNDRAEVIGINTAIIVESQGIGFAVNIDDAKLVVAQLIEKGIVERGFLGITPVDLTPAVISQIDLALPPGVTEGILVLRAISGFPAADAGLRDGDVIVQLGSEAIVNTGEMSKFLLTHPPGETITISFFRGSEQVTIEVTLGDRSP